jgi:hypothetical protein
VLRDAVDRGQAPADLVTTTVDHILLPLSRN